MPYPLAPFGRLTARARPSFASAGSRSFTEAMQRLAQLQTRETVHVDTLIPALQGLREVMRAESKYDTFQVDAVSHLLGELRFRKKSRLQNDEVRSSDVLRYLQARVLEDPDAVASIESELSRNEVAAQALESIRRGHVDPAERRNWQALSTLFGKEVSQVAGRLIGGTDAEETPDSSATVGLKTYHQLLVTNIAPNEKPLMVLKKGPEGEEIQVMSDYALQTVIGSGGQSTVWRARETTTDRIVAIKIINNDDRKTRELFEGYFDRERRIQGLVEDARIVRVYTSGVTAEGQPYSVMEFCSGGNVENNIDADNDKPSDFDIYRVIRHFTQATAALAVAHEAGVAHRDIKPSNFFLDDKGNIKLGDFGVAQIAASHPVSTSLLPLKDEGHYVGTPPYMSYELWRDGASNVDPLRADVYAMGVAMYEMLTGELPYDCYTVQQFMVELAQRSKDVSDDERRALPPPPSKTRMDRPIPKALDRIVMKALSIEAKDRYANATELLFDLATLDAQELEQSAKTIRGTKSDPPDAPSALLADRQKIIVERRNIAEWESLMLAAIQAYEAAYRDHPIEAIKAKLVEMLFELWQHADERGDDRLVENTMRAMNSLKHEASDQRIRIINEPIRIMPQLTRPIASDNARFILTHASNSDGDLTNAELHDVFSKVPDRGLALKRGGSYKLTVVAPGIVPVAIPLPVRPGQYDVRIPIYPKDHPKIPSHGVLIPAGPVVARTDQKSYASEIADSSLRHTSHDYIYLPFVTNQDWRDYIVEEMKRSGNTRSALQKMPRHFEAGQVNYLWDWVPEKKWFRSHVSGEMVDPKRPVYNVPIRDVMDFLEAQGTHLTLPSLNEAKRAVYGNDARTMPWGDSKPIYGTTANNYYGHAALTEPMPIYERTLDVSPFSVYDEKGHPIREVGFVISNLRRYISVSDEERRRILDYFGQRNVDQMTRKELQRFVFSFGSAFDEEPANSAEIVHRMDRDDFGRIGIQPIIRLDRVR